VILAQKRDRGGDSTAFRGSRIWIEAIIIYNIHRGCVSKGKEGSGSKLNVTRDLHYFRLLVRTVEDDVGGGVYCGGRAK
jgi:hypothetical protein